MDHDNPFNLTIPEARLKLIRVGDRLKAVRFTVARAPHQHADIVHDGRSPLLQPRPNATSTSHLIIRSTAGGRVLQMTNATVPDTEVSFIVSQGILSNPK
jgi:hypothetical protein